MIRKLDEEEEILWEVLHDPVGFIEVSFSDLDNLIAFNDTASEVRAYQYPVLSYEYSIDDDDALSNQENFDLKKGAGELYCYGARKWGKSLIVIILDILTSCFLLDGWGTIMTSFDAVHVRKILSKITPVIENHPLFSGLKQSIKQSPTWQIILKNGFTLEGVNMNLVSGERAGDQFFGNHVKKIWVEEDSKTNLLAESKMVDAVSEFGAIFRRSGMTDFTKYNPAGKLFYGEHKERVCNLPQMVNPTWSKGKKQEAIKKYNGENSNNYRIYVNGEIIEDGVSAIDMDRVRKFCYNEAKEIKRFEIKKEDYDIYQNLLVLELPKGAEEIYLCGDIGTSAPSELVIVSKFGSRLNYTHNIVLHNLSHKEQFEIFKYIIDKLKVNFVGIDTGDGTGLAIHKELSDYYDTKNIFAYNGSGKIVIGFEKDKDGNVVIGPDGKPKEQKENMRTWGVHTLRTLFYEGGIEIPIDLKFDIQMNSVISTKSSTKEIYECTAEQDHLFDAFVVFGATQWVYEYSSSSSINKKQFFKGGV